MHSLRPDIQSRPASVPVTSSTPSNDDIEAVIQLATSSRPSPDGRPGPHRDTRTQLFVGNLPYRVRWQDLKDLFRKAGTVLRADVSLGPDNRSRGYGTVLLATAEDAGRAVDMFNGYSWQTRILEVRPDRLPPDFIESANNNHSNSTGSTGSGTGVGPFVGHGTVASNGVPPFPTPSVSAIMDEYEYVNSIFGPEPPPTAGGRNLFIGNLPFHCQWQDLKDLFRQAGTIIRADVALGQDGRSRGFGTVVFATEFDADRAVKMFNGYEYNGRPLKVHYDKFSQSSQPTTMPASPNLHASATPGPSVSTPSFPAHSFASAHLSVPLGFPYEFGPPSGPTSPFDLYPPSLQPPRSGGLSAAVSSSLANLGAGPTSSASTPAANEHINNSPAPSELHVHHMHHHSHGSAQGHSHPHPGPIALPLPGPISLSLPPLVSPLHHPLSPFTTGAGSNGGPGSGSGSGTGTGVHLTPHGLPPITPSMPPFSFAPEHMLGSPAGAAMSPGAFWAGGSVNPFINPVVGAPVRGESEMGIGGREPGGGDYFPSLAGAGDGGYFPPLGNGEGREELRSTGLLGLGLGASKLANEILRDGDLFGGMTSTQKQVREPEQGEQEIQWREEDAGGLVRGIEAVQISDGSDDSESKSEGNSGNESEGEHKRGRGNENGDTHEAPGERHPRAGSAGVSKPPGMVLVHRPESDPVQARPRGEAITRTGVSAPARGHEEELGVVGVNGVGMSTNKEELGIGA